MSSSKSTTSRRCPKYCPKQCAACPTPAVIPDNIPPKLMEQMVESAYAEKAGCGRSFKITAKGSKMSRCYQNDFMKSDECAQIPLTLPIALRLMKNWYREVSFETEDALYDLKCIWNTTDGEVSRKVCATNRLFIYYLIILAIYIIQTCFAIDEKLFEGVCKIIASREDDGEN